MTKADLVEAVYSKLGIPKNEVAEYVDLTLEIIKSQLESGQDINISGFGHFQVREKRARVGRNPKTNDKITISERKVITFKPSQILRRDLNS